MIFFKRFVSLFGVALCAAPILVLLVPAASAQQGSLQGNNQSQMLFEMQAMRQEIAELRDMVERQAYQLRQMENAKGQSANQAHSNAAAPSVNPSIPSSNSNYQQPSPSAEYQAPAGVAYSDVTQANSQFERANESNSPSLPPVQERVGQEGVGSYGSPVSIEERPIGQTQGGLPDAYPPVEERTIGGSQTGQQVPAYNPETYNQPTAVVTESDYNQQVPIANQVPTANQQVVPVSDPNFPTPYQRDTPARQPVVNNIPPAGASAAPGGIVTIPQASVPVMPNNSPAVQNTNTASLGEQTYYQQGFELLKQSKHDEAVSTFKKQIADYPSGEYADDAHYWIAESLYVNRNLDESKLYFKAITDKFSQSPRLPDAMLKTAYIEQEQGNNIEARILLQEIIQFHPRSNAAISAKNRLADLN